MVRRSATEPKTGFPGVVFVASFRTLRVSMAIFNAGIALRPFCCWGLSVIVEMQDEHEEAVRKRPSRNRHGRPSRYRARHRFDQCGEENNHTANAAVEDGDRLIT